MNPPVPPLPPYPPSSYPPPYPPPGFYPPGVPYPLTFGQILDSIGRIVRTHWKTLGAIGVVPFGFACVLEGVIFGGLGLAGAFKTPPVTPSTTVLLSTVFPCALLFIPLMIVMYGLYYGASTYAALQADAGLPVTFAQAYAHAWSRLGRYTGLMLLRGLIVILPFILIGLAGLAATALITALSGHQNASTGLLFLLIPLGIVLYAGAIVWTIVVGLRLSLAFCACVHEGIPARQAITRSGVLTQGAKGRIFLVLLVVYAISYAGMMVIYFIGLGVSLVVIGLSGIATHTTTPLGYFAIGLVILCAAVIIISWAALLMAAYAASFAVVYRDQCVRLAGPPAAPPGSPSGFPPGFPGQPQSPSSHE